MSTDEPLIPAGDKRYHEGDATLIPFEITEEFDDEFEPWEEPEDAEPVYLGDMTEIEFIVKEDRTDTDSDALLTKTMADGAIEIVDANAGQLSVLIETDDTDGWLDDPDAENGRKEKETFDWVLQLTDEDGNRVSGEVGTLEIHAS